MPFQKAINKKQVGLQPYSHNGGPLLEPLEEWHISKRLDPTVYQNMTMRERKESADV